MKAKEKRMIFILVCITIIMFVVMIIVKNNNTKKQSETNNGQNNSLIKEENGTKQSTSDKLKETKKIDNLEVMDIQIIEVNGEATITANITNQTGGNIKEFPITIKILNEKGEMIQKVGAYVRSMKDGETTSIHAGISMNINEIYDVTFERK